MEIINTGGEVRIAGSCNEVLPTTPLAEMNFNHGLHQTQTD